MTLSHESVTLTVPRSTLSDVMSLSAALLDRMHDLLERNTNGELSTVEGETLETLVRMAQFGQIVTMAFEASLPSPNKP